MSELIEIETHDVGGLTAKIVYDPDPSSPREWDNLGTMTCFHRRYNLGDKHSFEDSYALWRHILPEGVYDRLDARWEREIEATYRPGRTDQERVRLGRDLEAAHRERVQKALDKAAIILPLYLYDHSGISISTGSFSCPWDSGQVGWVWITLDAIRKEWKTKRVSKKLYAQVEKALRQEVKTYDDFLTGQVYGFIVEDEDGDTLDSCWGFYDADDMNYVRQEALDSAAYQLKQRSDERFAAAAASFDSSALLSAGV